MPLFAISRELDPQLRPDEREAMTMRSLIVGAFFPAVRWQRSFVIDQPDRLSSLCIFEGPSLPEVAEVSRCARVPFSEIREVTEDLPSDWIDPESNRTPEGAKRYLIYRTIPPEWGDDEFGGAIKRSTLCIGEHDELAWDRSYGDAALRNSWCIFWAPNAQMLEDHAHWTRLPCDTVDEVVEVLPSEWAHVYDGLGLPRHWEIVPAASEA